MSESDASATSFKNWFNPERYESIAASLAGACNGFDRDLFLRLVLEKLDDRELMDRLRQTAIAADAALPGSYADKLTVLERVAADSAQGFVGIWFSEFASLFGAEDPSRALAAMRWFTRYGSAEFAIRPYLLRDPESTLRTIETWTTDVNEHVRRLASEGSRPRLPWGLRLGFLIDDPRPTRAILEALKNDPALYVRKSVANHLNDIAKDHPDYVVEWVRSWDRSDEHIAWVVKHGLRTLIKRGHPGALKLMGAGAKPKLHAAIFEASPNALSLGDELTLDLSLQSASSKPQTLIIDYIIHYVKASGKTSPKVFKWKQIELAATGSISIRKRQRIRDFTTRRHHSGVHRVVLQINGQAIAETQFSIR